jgi:hypothetical protein
LQTDLDNASTLENTASNVDPNQVQPTFLSFKTNRLAMLYYKGR